MSSALLLDRLERKQPARRVVTLSFEIKADGTGDEKDGGGMRDLGLSFTPSIMIVRQLAIAATAVANTVLFIGCDFANDRVISCLPAATTLLAPGTTFNIGSPIAGIRKFYFWQNGTATRAAIDGVVTLTLEFVA